MLLPGFLPAFPLLLAGRTGLLTLLGACYSFRGLLTTLCTQFGEHSSICTDLRVYRGVTYKDQSYFMGCVDFAILETLAVEEPLKTNVLCFQFLSPAKRFP